MNRIGWFVVCFVTASAVQSSLGDGTPAQNRGDFNTITKLKPVPKILDPDVAQICNFFDDLLGTEVEIRGQENEARTFGHRRVTMMMLAPLMYKMGVMMTMLTVLTVLSLKGLLIGLILLVLKVSSFLAKFHVGLQHQGYGHAWPPQPQPVHVHIHGGDGYHSHGQAYSAWPSSGGPQPDEEQHYYYKG